MHMVRLIGCTISVASYTYILCRLICNLIIAKCYLFKILHVRDIKDFFSLYLQVQKDISMSTLNIQEMCQNSKETNACLVKYCNVIVIILYLKNSRDKFRILSPIVCFIETCTVWKSDHILKHTHTICLYGHVDCTVGLHGYKTYGPDHTHTVYLQSKYRYGTGHEYITFSPRG